MQNGKLTALAVTSAQRTSLMPDTPSMREIGAKDVNIEVWNALITPAGMHATVQGLLSDALVKVLGSAEIKEQLLRQAWTLDDPSPVRLSQRIAADRKMYNELIARKKLQLE
ncbi:Tripartite tricarboxylate transporter family receptor [compost metagenome]